MFTRNTRDSSGVNPEDEAREIYTWTAECITRKHRWGMVWLACTTAGILIIVVLFVFTVFSFLPNWNASPSNFWQWISYCWLYPSKEAVDRFMVFWSWPCSILPPGTLSRANSNSESLHVLLALADYWSRGVWIISQAGYRLNRFHDTIQIHVLARVLTTNICWHC